MSNILYGKIRLNVPSELDGETAILTTPKGITRSVIMTSPKTNIHCAGLEEYRIQAGTTDEKISLDYGQMKSVDIINRILLKKLPYTSGSASVTHSILAIVLNGEIHILGGYMPYTYNKFHYKWDGSDWVSVSTLPYAFGDGAVVVLNNEIHILGGGITSSLKNHYKWDGSDWVSVSTLPYEFKGGSAIVLNGEIHILGSTYQTYNGSTYTYPNGKKHYKWNGSNWTSVSTLPYSSNLLSQIAGSGITIFNNQIHLIGGYPSTENKIHYRFTGSSWTSVSTLPENANVLSAVIYKNEIHILGGTSKKMHYKWNGSTWVSVSTLPYNFYGGAGIVANNEIYILGTRESGIETSVAQWDGTSWTVAEE